MKRWAIPLLLIVAGCGGQDEPDSIADGCTSDFECRNDRLCVHGECVDAGTSETPTQDTGDSGFGAPSDGFGPTDQVASKPNGELCASAAECDSGACIAANEIDLSLDISKCVPRCLSYADCPGEMICAFQTACFEYTSGRRCCGCLELAQYTIRKGSDYQSARACAEALFFDGATYPIGSWGECGGGVSGAPCESVPSNDYTLGQCEAGNYPCLDQQICCPYGYQCGTGANGCPAGNCCPR